MAFTEDLSVFFDTNDFAVVATIKNPDGSKLRDANVIFDDGRQNAELLNAGIELPNTTMRCQTADLAGVTHNHKVAIGATTYRIINRQDDGAGVSTVALQV